LTGARAKPLAIPKSAQKSTTSWDSNAEYKKEKSLSKSYSVPTVEKIGDEKANVGVHWAKCVADASQCPHLMTTGEVQSQALTRTRLARGSATGIINLSAFPVARTPRGVPLIISPLSQYEDRCVSIYMY
jgi:hypothetical protein